MTFIELRYFVALCYAMSTIIILLISIGIVSTFKSKGDKGEFNNNIVIIICMLIFIYLPNNNNIILGTSRPCYF